MVAMILCYLHTNDSASFASNAKVNANVVPTLKGAIENPDGVLQGMRTEGEKIPVELEMLYGMKDMEAEEDDEKDLWYVESLRKLSVDKGSDMNSYVTRVHWGKKTPRVGVKSERMDVGRRDETKGLEVEKPKEKYDLKEIMEEDGEFLKAMEKRNKEEPEKGGNAYEVKNNTFKNTNAATHHEQIRTAPVVTEEEDMVFSYRISPEDIRLRSLTALLRLLIPNFTVEMIDQVTGNRKEQELKRNEILRDIVATDNNKAILLQGGILDVVVPLLTDKTTAVYKKAFAVIYELCCVPGKEKKYKILNSRLVEKLGMMCDEMVDVVVKGQEVEDRLEKENELLDRLQKLKNEGTGKKKEEPKLPPPKIPTNILTYNETKQYTLDFSTINLLMLPSAPAPPGEQNTKDMKINDLEVSMERAKQDDEVNAYLISATDYYSSFVFFFSLPSFKKPRVIDLVGESRSLIIHFIINSICELMRENAKGSSSSSFAAPFSQMVDISFFVGYNLFNNYMMLLGTEGVQLEASNVDIEETSPSITTSVKVALLSSLFCCCVVLLLFCCYCCCLLLFY
jgi:hypothetical protein